MSSTPPYTHAGLASQALDVMIALTPRVRDAIGSQLSAKQAVFLSEFDRVLSVRTTSLAGGPPAVV